MWFRTPYFIHCDFASASGIESSSYLRLCNKSPSGWWSTAMTLLFTLRILWVSELGRALLTILLHMASAGSFGGIQLASCSCLGGPGRIPLGSGTLMGPEGRLSSAVSLSLSKWAPRCSRWYLLQGGWVLTMAAPCSERRFTRGGNGQLETSPLDGRSVEEFVGLRNQPQVVLTGVLIQ